MEFLDNFEKRMEWVGIADSIVNRRGRDARLEGMFAENEVTNIIFSVLLFIMEKTLEENNECDLKNIEYFVDKLLKNYYDMEMDRADLSVFTGYIVKDVLQNNGEKLSYKTMNYTAGRQEQIPIRLVADKMVVEGDTRKITYMLTNQGYSFLFRTREVDEEIQLTMEQLKLKEYVKRKKFSSAVKQSVELISFVRQKKKDIESFIMSIRQNVLDTDISKYEQLLKSTYVMLQDEYETMNEILNLIKQAEEKIKQELEDSNHLEGKLAKAIKEIQEIHHNIGVVISEQRVVIINRYNMSDLYLETSKSALEYSFVKRFKFEEEILEPLDKYSLVLDDCINLLNPLLLPSINSKLSIDQIFNRQMIFKERETSRDILIEKDDLSNEEETKRLEDISQRHVNVLKVLLEKIIQGRRINLSEIIDWLKENDIKMYEEFCRERDLFKIAFKLYDIENIRLKDFYENKGTVLMNPAEHFNMERSLMLLQKKISGIEKINCIRVSKAETEIAEMFEFTENEIIYKGEVKMSDLIFEVVE